MVAGRQISRDVSETIREKKTPAGKGKMDPRPTKGVCSALLLVDADFDTELPRRSGCSVRTRCFRALSHTWQDIQHQRAFITACRCGGTNSRALATPVRETGPD